MAIATWTPPPPPDPFALQNPSPFRPFPLIHLSVGKVKPAFGKPGLASGIFKSALRGPVNITTSGIAGDEHAYEPHRSPDKAVHHYSAAHYPLWRQELPESAHLFRPGAFGENLFSSEIDETTVCIGDKIAIGDVVLEVSEPRTPCFKLNHRFQVRNMASRTQTLLRCGWLYRVLEPGSVQPGDSIQLLERPCPEWTVARVMYYLFLERENYDRIREIVALPALGAEIRDKFQLRLDKGQSEDQNRRMYGDGAEKMDTWTEYRIVDKRRETNKVFAFVFEAVETIPPEEVVPVQPGSHVRVKLGGRLVRAYSVIGGTSQRFELGIALDANSRGGSRFLHEQTEVGDVLACSQITTSFPLAKEADKHVIIAGGIGITAFLAAAQHLEETKQLYEVYYAVADEMPFHSHITRLGSNATVYRKSLGQRLDPNIIMGRADSNTHIYCCGPPRLMDAVRQTATVYNIPNESVHFENFTVTTSGQPFTARLQQSGKTLEIPGDQSLLDVLTAAGLDVDRSCEVGNCGTCRVDLCGKGNRVEHRGTGLLEEEKETAMLACVSRGDGLIVLDL